ncbi:MAG TPA: MFS transporter [Ktedonobacteraceae bacterium]
MDNANRDISQDIATPVETASQTQQPPTTRDPYQALRFRDFRLLFSGTFLATMGEQMIVVAIGWELYERTGSSLALGFVGLVQVSPVIALALIAGHIADRFDRKRIAILTQMVLAVGSLGLAVLSLLHGPIFLMYACLFGMWVAVAFNSPAVSTLPAQILPEHAFENAATWNSSSWQLASVLGPALSGLIIALFNSTSVVYVLNAVTALIFACLLLPISVQRQGVVKALPENTTMQALGEGVSFLRRTPVLLAAITLDLFAVLFGGATTLLPVFAKDILHVGPEGLGWLRAAPSIGAVCVALVLAHRPPFKRAGRILLIAVIGFGIATIIFGASRSFWLSLLMLFLLGGLDNISVVIRSTLTLTRTPDAMRGRVAAINNLFVSASNELGGFESGLTAQLFGPAISVVGGGIGTILVVLLIALIWPDLRRLRTIRET